MSEIFVGRVKNKCANCCDDESLGIRIEVFGSEDITICVNCISKFNGNLNEMEELEKEHSELYFMLDDKIQKNFLSPSEDYETLEIQVSQMKYLVNHK